MATRGHHFVSLLNTRTATAAGAIYELAEEVPEVRHDLRSNFPTVSCGEILYKNRSRRSVEELANTGKELLYSDGVEIVWMWEQDECLKGM